MHWGGLSKHANMSGCLQGIFRSLQPWCACLLINAFFGLELSGVWVFCAHNDAAQQPQLRESS